jgi:HPt (histidine-containing phosphotransfer) domain-containing protein
MQTEIREKRSAMPRLREAIWTRTDDIGLDDLRAVFQSKLQSERAHFVALSAALARAEDGPGPVFNELRNRAHKMRGSAAVFEMAQVASAAGSLEVAAIAATVSHADNTDAAVWTALVALVRFLATLDTGDSTPLSLVPSPGAVNAA